MTNGAEKIAKALRCCSNGSCSECVFHKDKQHCQETMEWMAADMIEYLSAELERTKRERDAAIRDLTLLTQDSGDDSFCKYYKHHKACVSLGCSGTRCSKFEWRGVCGENSGGDGDEVR